MKKNLIIEIAKYYYIHKLTQEEIAKILGISRMKVVRYLKKARKEGYVKIQIAETNERCSLLENLLKSEFNLKEAIIFPVLSDVEFSIRKKIGYLGAEYLKSEIRDNDVVGISWGRSTYEAINSLTQLDVENVKVVQVVGGMGKISDKIYPNEIIARAAFFLGNHYSALHAPLFVESDESKRAIISTKVVKDVINMWDSINVILLGVGSMERNAHILVSSPEQIPSILQETKRIHAAAELCGRFYDINGKICKTKLNDLVIAVHPEKIRNIKNSILLASGRSKIKAIISVLRGNFFNTIITDESTAKEVLKYHKKE